MRAVLFCLALVGCAQPWLVKSGERVSASCRGDIAYCHNELVERCGGRGWSTQTVASHYGNPLAPHREPDFQWLDDPEYDHEVQGLRYFRMTVECL